MSGKNFPIEESLRNNILDAWTISRSGPWWAAVLVIKDPRSGALYLAFYRWRSTKGEWKKVSGFKINSRKSFKAILAALEAASMEQADQIDGYPVSEFLRSSVLNGRTIVSRGVWWSAVLAIRDPRSEKEYTALYRWQKRGGAWKRLSSFKINSDAHRLKIIEILKELAGVLGWA